MNNRIYSKEIFDNAVKELIGDYMIEKLRKEKLRKERKEKLERIEQWEVKH